MRPGEPSDAVGQEALIERVVVLPALVWRLKVVHVSEAVVLARGEVLSDELAVARQRKKRNIMGRNQTWSQGGVGSGSGPVRGRRAGGCKTWVMKRECSLVVRRPSESELARNTKKNVLFGRNQGHI